MSYQYIDSVLPNTHITNNGFSNPGLRPLNTQTVLVQSIQEVPVSSLAPALQSMATQQYQQPQVVLYYQPVSNIVQQPQTQVSPVTVSQVPVQQMPVQQLQHLQLVPNLSVAHMNQSPVQQQQNMQPMQQMHQVQQIHQVPQVQQVPQMQQVQQVQQVPQMQLQQIQHQLQPQIQHVQRVQQVQHQAPPQHLQPAHRVQGQITQGPVQQVQVQQGQPVHQMQVQQILHPQQPQGQVQTSQSQSQSQNHSPNTNQHTHQIQMLHQVKQVQMLQSAPVKSRLQMLQMLQQVRHYTISAASPTGSVYTSTPSAMNGSVTSANTAYSSTSSDPLEGLENPCAFSPGQGSSNSLPLQFISQDPPTVHAPPTPQKILSKRKSISHFSHPPIPSPQTEPLSQPASFPKMQRNNSLTQLNQMLVETLTPAELLFSDIYDQEEDDEKVKLEDILGDDPFDELVLERNGKKDNKKKDKKRDRSVEKKTNLRKAQFNAKPSRLGKHQNISFEDCSTMFQMLNLFSIVRPELFQSPPTVSKHLPQLNASKKVDKPGLKKKPSIAAMDKKPLKSKKSGVSNFQLH